MALAPPHDLGSDGRSAWRSALIALEAIHEDPAHSRTLLGIYCRAVDMEAHLRRAWVAAGRPTTTATRAGRELEHPMVAELRAQAQHVAGLADMLGLAPRSRASMRSRVGRPQGTSQAPDRRPGLRRVVGGAG